MIMKNLIAGGSDYGNVSTEITITGTETVSALVVIFDDRELEGSENFFAHLVAGDGAANHSNIVFGPVLASASIVDNDDGNQNIWGRGRAVGR
jgi:hypothetical protein